MFLLRTIMPIIINIARGLLNHRLLACNEQLVVDTRLYLQSYLRIMNLFITKIHVHSLKLYFSECIFCLYLFYFTSLPDTCLSQF